MTDAVVHLDGATRHFGGRVALDGLSFDAPPGAITVLLGPNGAGKTTAIRLVTGALAADRGVVRTFGVDPADSRHGEAVRRRCGVVSAKPALYDRLSGEANLRYAADLHGLPHDRARLRAAAARFAIDDALHLQVGGYSTGMKTRLALARATLCEPDLLLLDEPTSGLDPESSAAVLGLIRAMTAEGRTVVLCTHLLAEAEGLADHVVVLDHGTVAVQGSPGDLVRRYWPEPLLHLRGEGLGGLGRLPGVRSVRTRDGGPDAVTAALDSLDRVPEVIAELVAIGARLRAVEPFEPTLEDLYFAVRSGGATDHPMVPS